MKTFKEFLNEYKEEPYKVGQKVKTNDGRRGVVSFVYRSVLDNPHSYKVAELYNHGLHLDDGSAISHTRLTPIK